MVYNGNGERIYLQIRHITILCACVILEHWGGCALNAYPSNGGSASIDGAARYFELNACILDHALLEVVRPVTLHGNNIGWLEANWCQVHRLLLINSTKLIHSHLANTVELRRTLNTVLVPVVDKVKLGLGSWFLISCESLESSLWCKLMDAC